MSASHAQWVARRGIVRPPTIPPGGAGIGPFWRVCDVQVDGGRGGWDVAEWAVSIGVELGQFTVDVHGDGAEEVDVVVVGGPQVGQHLVLDQLATGAHFGDGAAVVLADPGDDRSRWWRWSGTMPARFAARGCGVVSRLRWRRTGPGAARGGSRPCSTGGRFCVGRSRRIETGRRGSCAVRPRTP